MDNYEKLLSLTDEKLSLSSEFLKLTQKLKQDLDNDVFDSLNDVLTKRYEVIESIDMIDEQFVSLYNEISSSDNFEKKLKDYPGLSENIVNIRQNFKASKDLDTAIMPLIDNQFSSIKAELKDLKNQADVQKKYGQDSIERVTMDNFGVFFDETK